MRTAGSGIRARAVNAAAGVTAGVVVLLAGIHLSPARSFVRDRALAWLRSSTGMQVSVEDLSYNLFTLDVRLRGVTATAAGADAPFLVAADIHVDLPWSAVRGTASIDRLDVDGLAVTVVRRADGSLNLPTFDTGGAGRGPGRVDLGRLNVAHASLRYDDLASGTSVDAGDVAVDLAPAANGAIAGRLTVGRGPEIRVGTLVTRGTIGGTLAYDGTSLALTELVYASALGRVRIDGRLSILAPTPTASLTVNASAALEPLCSAFAIEPAAFGTLELAGSIEGPLASPTATLAVTSSGLRWRHLAATGLTARAVATTDGLTLDSLALTIADGTAEMRGRLLFDPLRATANVDWRNLAAAEIAGPYAPAPMAARLSGHAEIDGDLGAGLSALNLTANLRADAPRATSTAIGIDGDLSLTLAQGEWRLRHAHELSGAIRIEGSLAGRLGAAGIAEGTLGGDVTAAAASATRLIQLLRTAGAAPPDWLQPQSGRLDAHLTLGGTLGTPRAWGRLDMTDVRVAGSQPLTAELSLTAGLDRFGLDAVKVTAGDNILTGSGTFAVASGAVRGAFDLDVSDFAASGPVVAAWQPSGRVTARIELAGTRARPLVSGTVSGSALAAAGQTLGDLSAAVAYANAVVSATDLELRQPDGGRLSATGTYAIASGQHSLALRAEGLRITPIEADAVSWPVAAVVDGHVDVRGTIAHPQGGGRLTLTGLGWESMHLDRADADITLSDAGAETTLSVPSLALSIHAMVEPRAPYSLAVSASAADTAIPALVGALGATIPPALARLTGTVSANVKAAGTLEDMAGLVADAVIERIDLRDGDARLQLDRPAAAHYTASTLAVRDLRLRTGTTTIDVAGEISPSSATGLSVSLSGTLADLRPWTLAAGLPSEFALDGAVSGTARATGSLERIAVTGDMRLAQGRIAWPGYPAASDVAVRITIANDTVDVPTLSARWQDIAAEGRLSVPIGFLAEWLPAAVVAGVSRPAGVALLQGRVDNVTPAALAPFAGEGMLDVLKGRTNLQVDLRADGPALERVSGSVLLTELSMTAVGLPVEQVRPTRVEIADGRLRVADWTWTVAGSQVGIAGEAGLVGDRAIDVRLAGRLDLRVLGVFLPAVTTSGTGDLAVAVRGTMAEPLAEGTVRLDNAEVRLADPQIAVSNASGLVVLRANRVEVSGLEGGLNGGRFSMRGGLDYHGLALTGGSLSVDASGVALDIPKGMRTEVNAALTMAVADRIQVSGRIDVVQGAYREPISLAAAFAAAAREREAPGAVGGASSLLERVDINIVMASTEDLLVDNNYGRMDLGLDLRLVGTAAAPSVVGRAIVREGGVLYLGGRTYLIERGVIDFSNPRAIVPELDLSARTRISGVDETGAPTEYDITLAIAGTADTLETTLSSDPTRGQADIVSLLATGRLADQVGGAGGAVAREQLLGYLSGEALGFAAHAVGLDSIRFERGAGEEALQSDPSIAGEVNPAQRLTISRRVSRFVEVTISQNLRDTGRLTWVAAYTPRRAIETRAVSRDDHSRSYELRHDVSFGAPPAPQTPRSAAARVRVSGIRIGGDPVFATAQVEAMLTLTIGSPFDFYRWQQDRERLRRFYVDRGYREVRVSARQTPQAGADGAPGVALEYQIQAGPQTALEVDGYRLPKSVVQELERVWSNAVVEVALVDDIRSAVRRHLAEQGYLRADVQVARVPPASAADAKRLRVRIAPGPRSASRSVEATGNTRLTGAEIDAAAARLGSEAWLTPATLADEISGLYRQRGLMAAAVTAGPITFADAAAVLPVRVTEGPQFTIGRLVVEGARARPDAAARKDLGLTEGAPYAPDALPPARQALARGYARDGFNAMTDQVETIVTRAAGTVEIRITIDEGPRQVLEDVAVDGARGVSPGVVSKALDLSPGTSVDADAWSAGRRRLLQTGLFSRVDIQAVPVGDAAPTPGIERVRAQVALVRRPPWRLRYGVNVTDEHAPQADQGRVFGGGVNASLERQGFFGRPGTSVGSLRYNSGQRIGRGVFTWPALFGRPVASRLFVSRSRDRVEGEGILSFVTDKTVVTAEQRLRIWGRAQLAYAYQFERNHVFDPNGDPNDPFALDERWRQARLTSSLVVDTRSDPFEPTRGQLHSSNLEYGLEVLGRNGRFVKYSVQQLVFASIAPRVISASGARVNLGKGVGQDLILSERFFAGGANTVRGYAEDSLGGFDVFGDPVPGQAALVLNQEIRFPVYRWVRAAGFVDAGNVYGRIRDMSVRSLKIGAGAGVRLSTPVGLFRLDLASRIGARVVDRRDVPGDDRPFKWTFSFGHTF